MVAKSCNNEILSFKDGVDVLIDGFSSFGSHQLTRNKLTIHTCGWSECEEFIDKFQKENPIWWMLHWYSTTRGGHYVFKKTGVR